MNRRVKYPAFLLLFSLAWFFPAADLPGQDFEGTKKRIADSGDQKPDRRIGDHARIHKDDVRTRRHPLNFHQGALGVIDNNDP